MKSKIIMLVSGLSLGMLACNDASTGAADDKDTTTLANEKTVDNTATDNTSVDVPAGTRTSFEAKYPNATNVRWNRYKASTDRDAEASDWNARLDTNDYEVVFNWDGAEYYAWYDDGNWVHASSPMKDHSKLPAAVNNTIKQQFAGYTIVEVDKEHDKDRTTYEVDLEKGEDKIKVQIDENGKVVKKKTKIDGEKTKMKEEDNH